MKGIARVMACAALAATMAAGAAEAGTGTVAKATKGEAVKATKGEAVKAAKGEAVKADAAVSPPKDAGLGKEKDGSGYGLEGVVNINTATPEELELLPGIGPTKAKAIMLYRADKPFKDPRHLVRVKGIGRATIDRILPFLAVTGPTTLKPK